MAENILTVNDGNFDTEVLTASKSQPVMVDFWAEWCRPCHMLAPTIEQLASELDGRVAVGKLNIDQNPATAARFGVQSIPTLLLFKDGTEVDRLIGVQPKQEILRRIDALR